MNEKETVGKESCRDEKNRNNHQAGIYGKLQREYSYSIKINRNEVLGSDLPDWASGV